LNYIGIDNEELPCTDEITITKRLFEFNVDKRDYFLNFKTNWNIVETKGYRFSIAGGDFILPSGFFIMLTDDVGEIDWIPVDESFARPLEFAAFNSDLNIWKAELPVVTGYEDVSIFWPMGKNIIPVQSNGVVLMISDKDHYQKFKNFTVDAFTIN
tara:strand:- start:80624 stop:81091 length:468 start_codon:yes stop_codon:yes gene_type:complete